MPLLTKTSKHLLAFLDCQPQIALHVAHRHAKVHLPLKSQTTPATPPTVTDNRLAASRGGGCAAVAAPYEASTKSDGSQSARIDARKGKPQRMLR
jgi:hypothetical protein